MHENMMRDGMPADPQETVGCGSPCVPDIAGLTDFFPDAFDGGAPIFLLQPRLGAIEYAVPDEVEQLYQSVNNAYVSPEGMEQEICQGYICCLKRGGSRSVCTALFGVQSGRTRVYLPDVPTTDEDSYGKAMTAALAFCEQMGLVMEAEKMGMSAEQRREWMRQCPVLREVI